MYNYFTSDNSFDFSVNAESYCKKKQGKKKKKIKIESIDKKSEYDS